MLGWYCRKPLLHRFTPQQLHPNVVSGVRPEDVLCPWFEQLVHAVFRPANFTSWWPGRLGNAMAMGVLLSSNFSPNQTIDVSIINALILEYLSPHQPSSRRHSLLQFKVDLAKHLIGGFCGRKRYPGHKRKYSNLAFVKPNSHQLVYLGKCTSSEHAELALGTKVVMDISKPFHHTHRHWLF